jgi:ribosomal protein S18 acetylase RimI-like enzyme
MHPLDNVIWKALTTVQAPLGVANERAAKFFAEVSILGALADPSRGDFESLSSLVGPGEQVGLFLDEDPQPRAPWKLVRSAPLLEMVYENGNHGSTGDHVFLRLGEADVPEMLALTELTKPGPFGRRTHEMGEYWGIRDKGKLIAMAGERLRLPGFTEVSAVCTHPDHLGKGYATALIAMLVRRIHTRGEQAFLHVRPENRRAVELYKWLGFRERLFARYVILGKTL